MKHNIFILSLVVLTVLSCKKKEKEEEPQEMNYSTELKMDLFFGDELISSPNTIYTLDNGYKVKVTQFKILFNKIKLGDTLLTDAAFYEFPNDYQNVFLKKKSKSFFSGDLNVNLGVDRDLNHEDPTLFPLENPMNILNASDMHWSWNPGYIFYKMELLLDVSGIAGEEHFDHPISYHIGLDDNFYTFQKSNFVQHSIGTHTKRIQLKLDFKAFLFGDNAPTNIITESISHSTGPQADIAVRVAREFKNNIKVY